MKLLLVGYGRMGQLVGSLAAEYGHEVAGIIDPMSPSHGGGPDDERWRDVDVAIDFSSADSVMANLPVLAQRGINLVVGTTGWSPHEAALRKAVADARIGYSYFDPKTFEENF